MGLDINWGLLGQPVDVAGAVWNGFQEGRQLKKQMQVDSAFSALAKNPNDPAAMTRLAATGPEGAQYAFGMQERAASAAERQKREGVRIGLSAAYDPVTGRVDPVKARQAYLGGGDVEGAMQFDQGLAKQQAAVTEQQRDMLTFGARVLAGVQSLPEAEREQGYQTALEAYKRAGFDTANVPPSYDERFVNGVVRAGQALAAPSNGDQFTLNPGDVRYGPDGRELVRSPYDPVVTAGGQVFARRPGSTGPAPAGVPKPGDVRMGYRFKGGDTKDPSNWEKVEGGQTPPASGNFP